MKIKRDDFKTGFRNLPLAIFAIVIAFVLTLILLYFNYYIHELGHANAALLTAQTKHIPSVTINFTYQDYILFGKNLGLKYPQQTWATTLPPLMSSYGVIFSIIFWTVIFLLLTKIKLIKNNNYLGVPLGITFIALILNDIISNLFCGTDGLKLSCSQTTFMMLFYIFWTIILLSLGFFFNLLFIILFNKARRKKDG